ncbi:sensor domain-containing diguanylate cyclase [Glaciecola sp. 1036]|uniref:sensor domain-containing diguanylate cyclase n=1 Tax=Alteromonadaceae TaxID=72275 RepID=UPI003CFD41E9
MANTFFGVPLFGEFTIYLGQIFVLLCLVTRGINAAIVATTIASVVTAVTANDPYLVVVLAIEILFVHAALKRGVFLFQSVMLFWLLIGTPLLLLLNFLTTQASSDVLIISAVVRGVNALICVSLAAICLWFLPQSFVQATYNKKPPRLASLIFSLCMLTVTLPALAIALFFVNQSAMQNQKAVFESMDKFSDRIISQVDSVLMQHKQGLKTVAEVLAKSDSLPTNEQVLLESTFNNNLAFSRINIIDKQGNIVNTTSVNSADPAYWQASSNVASEIFFKATQRSLDFYVSQAYALGSYAESPKVISLSYPILKTLNNSESFEGAVQGIIPLSTIDRLNDELITTNVNYVLTDEKSRILATSLLAPYITLSTLQMESMQHPLVDRVPVVKLDNTEYLLLKNTTSQGWQLHILANTGLVTGPIVNSFYMLILSATFVILAFALVASQLARKITKPLEDIAAHFPDKALHPKIVEESKVSDEIVKLTDRLISSHAVMSDFQQQLTEQVESKTKQLKQLNRELYSLAQKDGLTQLLNRAGFNRFALTSFRNCIRNHIPMSMILIDIDHFKRINDTYGHPFGDKCITMVAKILQKHCKRDTDIIGRFGGEEFIIMIVGSDPKEHHTRVKLISESIRQLNFTHDSDSVRITVSSGICSIIDDFSLDFDTLIKLADEQLYLSKRTGRDKTSVLVR